MWTPENMGEVAAGAAVVAFINLALKSTKTIYETASSIRKCPAEINSLVLAISHLEGVLNHLSNVTNTSLIEAQLDAESFRLFSNVLRACKDDVLRFERELGKIKLMPQDRKGGIVWKRIKSVLREAEFRHMKDLVDHHVSQLGLQLSIIQRQNSLEHKKLLKAANSDLTTLGSDVKDIGRASSSIVQQLRNNLTPLAQKLDQIPEMSALQSENICVLLKAIQEQISGLSAQASLPGRSRCQESPSHVVFEGPEKNPEIEEDPELERGIERLSQLAKAKEGTVTDTEAETITDDLNALLESVTSQTSRKDVESMKNRKRTIDEVEGESKIDGREMKRIRSLLDSASAIVINGTGIGQSNRDVDEANLENSLHFSTSQRAQSQRQNGNSGASNQAW